MYDPTASKISKLAALLRLARRRAREGHAPLLQQFAESTWLWAANGMTVPDYFCTGLYRTGLSWREKAEHLGSGRYMRGLRRVNDKRYDYIALNKLFGYGLMRAFGIPTPTVHAVVGRNGGYGRDGARIDSPDDLEAAIAAMNEPDICFKRVVGWSGRGFVKAHVAGSGGGMTLTVEPSGVVCTPTELLTNVLVPNKEYMLQALVRGHERLAAFNPRSLNTVRVWMASDGTGGWEPFGAVFRMGVGNVAVDNDPEHTIFAPVHINDGRLGIALDESVDRNEYSSHPVSGVAIEGATIPMWHDALALCARACRLLPFLRLVALDVAITTDGVMIMEVESAPGDDQVGFDRGVKSLFAHLSRQTHGVPSSSNASSTESTAETIV